MTDPRYLGDMATPQPLRPPVPDAPVELHARAMDNLRFIRETMERAGSFTAISGWGLVAIGVVALAASGVALLARTPPQWMVVWIGAALLAVPLGVLSTVRKARRARVTLLSGPGRKFALSLVPPLAAGAVLTAALFESGMERLLPGTWLLLFGVGIVAGGAFSVRAVPVMGIAFMAMGVLALFTPAAWGDVWMGAGFGGLHLIFGVFIARRHGG